MMLSVGCLLFAFPGCCFLRSNTDRLDLHPRQFAPMPNGAVIAFTSFILERDNFFVLTLFENFSSDLCPGDERVPVRHVLSVGKHQDLAERRGLARTDI